MSSTDLHETANAALGAFFALMVAEALIKPIATRLGTWLLHRIDHRVKWIPDWLSGHSNDEPPANG